MNIQTLASFQDDRGLLLPVEFKDCPFKPERVFFVHGVPGYMRRGCHAHYKTKQYIICLAGKVLVGLHDGKTLDEQELNPGEAVLVNEMIWDYQDFLTGHDVLAVFCSTSYDQKDYIFNFDEFLRLKNETLS